MPGWNECSIYDDTCRMRTCAHPTNPRNEVNYLGTKDGTENRSTGSVSVPQSEPVSVSMPSLERLTRAHVLALMAVVDEHAKTHPHRHSRYGMRSASCVMRNWTPLVGSKIIRALDWRNMLVKGSFVVWLDSG